MVIIPLTFALPLSGRPMAALLPAEIGFHLIPDVSITFFESCVRVLILCVIVMPSIGLAYATSYPKLNAHMSVTQAIRVYCSRCFMIFTEILLIL